MFVPWGIGLDVVEDMADGHHLSRARREQYAYIWGGTPSNPLLNITDIAATAAVAHARRHQSGRGRPHPVLQHPLADGADIIVSPATVVGGHSGVVGGAVALNDKETRDAVALYNAAGGSPEFELAA